MSEVDFGMNCTLWTVRISVLLYAVAVYRVRVRPAVGQESPDIVYRWTWAGSWTLCIVHVLCAFHFIHRWSHHAALEHTAEMTERVVGIYWSGGLYINYIFLAVWGADAVAQFRSHRTSKLLHFVAAFMMFNATVVFGPVWWIAPAAILVGILSFATYKRSHRFGDGHSNNRED